MESFIYGSYINSWLIQMVLTFCTDNGFQNFPIAILMVIGVCICCKIERIKIDRQKSYALMLCSTRDIGQNINTYLFAHTMLFVRLNGGIYREKKNGLFMCLQIKSREKFALSVCKATACAFLLVRSSRLTSFFSP